MLYTVGEMAKVMGVPASTLRYYDNEGILPCVERGIRTGASVCLRIRIMNG